VLVTLVNVKLQLTDSTNVNVKLVAPTKC